MKNMKKRAASVIVAAATVFSVGTASIGLSSFGFMPDLISSASAASGVGYVNATGAAKVCGSYTMIKSTTTNLTGGWYVVDGSVTIGSRLKVTGDSYIILTDDSVLTVKGGISVSDGCKFNVYTQAGGSGVLYAGTSNGSNTTAGSGQVGIGGRGAKINIVGGNVYAKGGSGSYGIYGDQIHLYWTNPTDSIYATSYNGTVSLYSDFVDTETGSAYEKGYVSASSIKNKTLSAARTVDKYTSVLEEGTYIVSTNVTVSQRMEVNGTVNLILGTNGFLKATEGITVNRGNFLIISGSNGKIYAGTSNGTSSNTRSNYAGIGAASGTKGGNIVINSGTIVAFGGSSAAGIGGSDAYVEINDGTVTATGGRYGAGIGSGYSDNGCEVRVLGGKVKANGGSGAAGIGSGYGSRSSAITLSYKNNTDSIFASSYNGSISFLKTLYNSEGQKATSYNIGNSTLTPTVKNFTVSFDTNGGSYIAPVSVVSGGTLRGLQDPVLRGYTFGGWYTDRALTRPFDVNRTAVTSNLTLYAKWIGARHVVTYDSNGGTNCRAVSVNDGETLTKLPQPTRVGYIFDGWYTDRNGYYLFDLYTPIYSDITLYAGWTPISTDHTITFYTNGGTYIAPLVIADGDSLNMRGAPSTERDGYIFAGWYLNKALTQEYIFGTPIYKDTILYAAWDVNPAANHTVRFYLDGRLVDTQTVKDGGYLSVTRYIQDYNWTTSSGRPFDLYNPIYEDYDLNAETQRTYTVRIFIDNGLEETQTVNEGERIAIRAAYYNYSWKSASGAPFDLNTPIYMDYDIYAISQRTYTVGIYVDGQYVETQTVQEGNTIQMHSAYYTYSWTTASGAPFDPSSTPIYMDYDLYATSSYDFGSTFGGAGLIAALVGGGVLLLGGGVAAGYAVGKKKNNK